MKTKPGFFPVSVMVLTMTLPLATQAQADWRDDLTNQIKQEHDCVVSFFTGAAERQVDGRTVVTVRVHCDDKRSFDAVRLSQGRRFEIKQCGEQAC